MDDKAVFRDLSAWFSNTVPSSFVNQWEKNGGLCTNDVSKANYLFSSSLTTVDVQSILVKLNGSIIFKPTWIESTLKESQIAIETLICFPEGTFDTAGEQQLNDAWETFQKGMKNKSVQEKTQPQRGVRSCKRLNDSTQNSKTGENVDFVKFPQEIGGDVKNSANDKSHQNLQPKKNSTGQGPIDERLKRGSTNKVKFNEDSSIKDQQAKGSNKKNEGDIKVKTAKNLSGFLYGSFEDFGHIDDLDLLEVKIKDFVANRNGCQVKLIY